jgi:hypothetical protein
VQRGAVVGVLSVDIDAVLYEYPHDVHGVILHCRVQSRPASFSSEGEVGARCTKSFDNVVRADADGRDEGGAAFIIWRIHRGAGFNEALDNCEVGHSGCGHEGSDAFQVAMVDQVWAHAANGVKRCLIE